MLGDLLDSPIAFHRSLALLAGSVAGGVMLSQAMYWTKRSSTGDGWFYKTQEEWEGETMLSRYEQEGIRKRLRTTAFWKEDLRGVPAKLFYRIDMQELRLALQASLRKNPKLASGKLPNKVGENQQALLLTKTTSETTSKKPKESPSDSSGASAPAWAVEYQKFWNENRGTLPECRELTKSRVHKLRLRNARESFLLNFGLAVERAAKTPFLRGENDRGWRCSFDFLIENDSRVVQVLEGKYDGINHEQSNVVAGNLLAEKERLEKKYGIA